MAELAEQQQQHEIPIEHKIHTLGITLQQRAAIALRVPRSGLDWLDDMIRESVRMDMIGRALPFAAEMFYRQVEVQDGGPIEINWDDCGNHGEIIGEDACALADAVLIESETEPVDKETRDKWRAARHRQREKERAERAKDGNDTDPQQQHRQHEIPADGGGPAYPWADPHQTSGLPAADPGMSLRDWFAGQALAGLASRTGCYEYVETMTRDAFTAADAMLVERAKEASTDADPDTTQS